MSTHRDFLFIGGDWARPASSKRIEVINATTEDLFLLHPHPRSSQPLPGICRRDGGVKASGLGRELGPESLASYQQLKSTYLPG